VTAVARPVPARRIGVGPPGPGHQPSGQFRPYGLPHLTDLLFASGKSRPAVVRVSDVHICGHSGEEMHVEMRNRIAVDLVVHLH
jgi:hypothetical protein